MGFPRQYFDSEERARLLTAAQLIKGVGISQEPAVDLEHSSSSKQDLDASHPQGSLLL